LSPRRKDTGALMKSSLVIRNVFEHVLSHNPIEATIFK
jgi:hypothetical protein